MPIATLSNVCADCQAVEASIDARKRWLCCDCFINYIRSKPIKRTESYRFKDDASEQPRRLLLPVSGGISSVTLLQILDRQLQRQLSRRGRTTYELIVLMVQPPSLDGEGSCLKCFDSLKHNFPYHTFSLLYLSSVFEFDKAIFEDLASFGITNHSNAQRSLENLISAVRTASSQADLLDVLLTRLIVAFAKVNKCEAVLWGHSNSRLAAKALTSVAEGRGGSLPFQISDGLSPTGVHFYYPLRDLFKPELVLYSKCLPATMSALVIHDISDARPPKPIRDTSISDLLENYINSQGEKYPSIMANVVRTANKLQVPSLAIDDPRCSVCTMPRGVKERNQNEVNAGEELLRLCLACQNSFGDMNGGDNR